MGPFLSEQKDDVMWQVEKLLKLTADAFFKRVSLVAIRWNRSFFFSFV